jgi:hypothetical protein
MMRLQAERLASRPPEQAWLPAPATFEYYEVRTAPVSFVERAS